MRSFRNMWQVGPQPDFSDLDYLPPFNPSPIASIEMRAPNGMAIYQSREAIKVVEDWSRVRSRGRALRRMKLGHRQNIDRIEEPCVFVVNDFGARGGGAMYAHPVIFEQLKKQFKADLERARESALLGMLRGEPLPW